MGSASTLHLSFRDHVHNLNAGQKDPGTAKRFESQHGAGASLDRAMVLLDDVVEIPRTKATVTSNETPGAAHTKTPSR